MPAVYPPFSGSSLGSIDATPIGGTTPSTGAFTSLSDVGSGAFGTNTGGAETVAINAAAGNTRQVIFQSGGLSRWNFAANNTTEGGSNAGSDLSFSAYSDVGSLLSTPLTITRSTGAISLTGSTTVSNTLSVGTNTTTQVLLVNGPAAVARPLEFRTAFSTRWRVAANGTAESGSNVGSDLDIITYTDAGAVNLNPAVRITRSSGLLTANGGIATTTLTASTSVNATAIGNTTPGSGVFTTLQANTALNLSGGSNNGLKLVADNGGLISGSNFNIVSFNGMAWLQSSGATGAGVAITGFASATMAVRTGSLNLYGTMTHRGTLKANSAQLSTSGANVTLDTGGSVAAYSSMAAAGSGYVTGDRLYDASNNVYTVTASAGAITSLAVDIPQVVFGATPSNPVTLTTATGVGTGATVNLTWTQATGLTLNPTGNVTVTNALAAGGTFSATSTFAQFGANAGTNLTIWLNAAAANNRVLSFTTAGSTRWNVGANNAAESGSNVGSDFIINRYTDAGAFVDAPLVITRSTGIITLNTSTTVASNFQVGTSGTARKFINNGPAASSRIIEFQTATNARWQISTNTTAEGGSNAGSDLDIITYNDAGTALINPAIRITRSTGAATFFANTQVTPTIATSAGSGAMFNLGDAVSANNDPFLYSYIVGSSSGAISSFGVNHYYSTGGVSTRPNTSKNAWYFAHDVRNATTDGGLVLRVISSAGSNAQAVQFATDGSIILSAGGLQTTTLSASSTVSGTGFSTYLASPPAIGGTAQASGSFSQVISGTNSVAGNFYLNGAANSSIGLRYQAGGVMRWILYNSGAESGSNTGDDFYIGRYNDAGTLIDQPLSILRSTGVVSAPQGYSTTGNYNCGGIFIPGLSGGTGGFNCRQGSTGTVGGNVFNVYWSGAAASLYVDSTNLGQFSFVSDARRKHSISPMPDGALERIKELNPVRFRWKEEGIFKDSGDEEEGLLAQDVLQSIPAAVAKDDTEDGTMSLKPLALIATLIKAVKELTAKVEALEAAQQAT